MCLRGSVSVVADKSISHRALILSSLAHGKSYIKNLSPSEDVKRTLNAVKLTGAKIRKVGEGIEIESGFKKEPDRPIYCGNSGTTARLMLGAISGFNLYATFYGDRSLSRRPMKRVTHPLSLMGARISGRSDAELLPLSVVGGNLKGITYRLPVASAQVKSAILLAGLNARGVTTVTEPARSRDHTERMLAFMGASISISGNKVSVRKSVLNPMEFKIPGDFSAASFLITLGVLHRDADFIIKDVNLNPTRTGFLKILEKMGCPLEIEVFKTGPEPVGEIRVKSCRNLHGSEIGGDLIPQAIDELPLLAILGVFAEGKTILKDAGELRHKESDRISAIVSELKKLGVKIEEMEDGFIVHNSRIRDTATLYSHKDHRIAMALEVLRQVSSLDFEIMGTEWVKISFPDFYEKIKELKKC